MVTGRNGVNAPLTANRLTRRPRRLVDNSDYAAFAARIIRAHGCRIADGDIDGLTHLAGLADQLDSTVTRAVADLRDFGYSWTEIAARLGITRQAAQQRWGGEAA